jgi:transcriptional regulator with PAS, ATPase and Fis domain
LLGEGDVIRPEDLPAGVRARTVSQRAVLGLEIPDSGVELEEIERALIAKALEKSGGNVTRAARLLGLSRRTLQYRLVKIEAEREGGAAPAPDQSPAPDRQ